MILKKSYIWFELVVLFFVLPLLLAAPIHPLAKGIPLVLGLVYCVLVVKKLNLVTLKSFYEIRFTAHWKKIVITFFLIIITSTALVHFLEPNNLFLVVIKKPVLWISIVFFYSIFSVYPQELLYRTYFFNRYQTLFKKPIYLLLVNFIAFPLAHFF